MLKTRTWIVLIAVAAVVLAVASILLFKMKKSGTVVQVVQNGEVLQEIDLDRVTKEYRFVVESDDGGHNTVLVQPGRICVEEADCPDRICVQQGWLSDQALPIVCMPHALVITIKDTSTASVDAATK